MKQIICTLTIMLAAVSLGFAQPPQSENPPTREFGWSLKQNPPEKPVAAVEQKNEPSADETPVDGDVIKVETNLVVNDIFVGDKRGQAVGGLKKNDFIVAEDGQTQKIETRSKFINWKD